MRYRLLAALIAALALLNPMAVYVLHVSMLGFPDGHLTELDLFEQRLFFPVAAVSVSDCGLRGSRAQWTPRVGSVSSSSWVLPSRSRSLRPAVQLGGPGRFSTRALADESSSLS